jgi:AhpD family alkylhydroperoxidase
MRDYPDFWEEEIVPFFLRVYEVSGIDPKTSELIVVALLSLRGWETGIRVHAKQAIDAGATPQQVRGAALTTLVVGGVHRAAAALDVIDRALEELEGA